MPIAIFSRPSASQNMTEPQTEQKPRRIRADERYQLSGSSPLTVSLSRATSVETQ